MTALVGGSDSEGQGGYQAQPWMTASANQSDIHLGQMNTGYPPAYGAPQIYGEAPVQQRQFV